MCLTPAVLGQPAEPEKLIEVGHWKRARAMVEARLQQAPQDAAAYFLLSQIRYAFGDRAAPLMLAEKAVALDGNVAKYHRQLAEALGVQAQHAGPLQQILLARRFRKEIDLALELDPGDIQALRDLMEFYLLAPGIAGGDSRQAMATAQRIGRIDRAAGFLAQARIADFHKQAAEMESLLRQAAQAQPPSYHAYIELGQFYLGSDHRNLEAAESAAKEALKLDRGRVEAYAILAIVYSEHGESEALDRMVAEASHYNADDRAPYYRAADNLLRNRRDPARAERYLRAYLEQEPEGNEPPASQAHWKLGLALEAEGRQAEALMEWREAVRLDPASPAAQRLKQLRRATPPG
jgi:tetratricopeptide (TPR) repeat protein